MKVIVSLVGNENEEKIISFTEVEFVVPKYNKRKGKKTFEILYFILKRNTKDQIKELIGKKKDVK